MHIKMHILRSRTNDNAAAEIELVVTRHNIRFGLSHGKDTRYNRYNGMLQLLLAYTGDLV